MDNNMRDIFAPPGSQMFDPNLYLCSCEVTDDMIYLPDELREEIDDIIRNIENPDMFGQTLGFRGYLFRGPPGTGKTLTSQYIATKTKSDLRQMSAFQRPKEVIGFFNYIRECAKNKTQLVLIDDIDGLSNRQDIGDQTQASVLTQLLTELNGVEENKDIYFIGTSNYFEKLDNALMRYKRLGKIIDFYPPQEKGRHEILKIIAYNLSRDKKNQGHGFKFKEDDLKKLAEKTYGYTGDDLYGILSQAANYANRRDSVDVTYKELTKAKEKIVPTALKDMPFTIPKKTLDDFVCLDTHIELILEAIGDFEANSEGINFLFYGDAGTGKSTLAEAVANHYKFNFVRIEGSSLVNSLVGRTGELIERVFSRCESSAPTILLLDEFHSLVNIKEWRGFVDNWTPRVRSRLSDGLKGVVIFATIPGNIYNKLDKETIDRYEYKLRFDLPSKPERAEIWKHYLRRNKINSKNIDVFVLSELSEGVSGREIEQVCNLLSRHKVKVSSRLIKELLEYYQSNEKVNHVELYKIITSHHEK